MVDLNITSMHIKNPSTGEWDEIAMIAGKSAYQSAVDGGYQGTEAEFNAALANGGTANALPLAGGTMEGDINMDGNAVTGLPTPSANSDAVSKSYTDNIVAVSDTQPTASENKLWVDTDASSGSTYQIPTVAEMETADAQVAAEIGAYVDNNFAPYNQIMVTGYSTYKMTLPSLSGHFVFIVGSSLSRSAILYIVVQNSGVVAVEEIQKGANFTYAIGTNELTFGNGATYAIYIKEIPIRGNSISVEPIS